MFCFWLHFPVCWKKSKQPLACKKWQQLVWPWPCGLRLSEAGGCSEKRRRVWSGVQRGPGQRRRQMLLALLLLQVTAGHALWWESTSWSVQSGWPSLSNGYHWNNQENTSRALLWQQRTDCYITVSHAWKGHWPVYPIKMAVVLQWLCWHLYRH